MDNLRISTMTAVCKISDFIDLDNLYDSININDIIKYVKFKEDQCKGYSAKAAKKTRKKTIKKVFFNQITIHIFNEKIINVKIFNNGKIQMTGLKNKIQGKNTINIVINELNKINNIDSPIYKNELKIENYEIVLINSDFDIKYKINREKLHRDLINKNMYSSYEPIMYPGVNMKYYYNTAFNNKGVCNCNNICNGKGSGFGDGECKKITIAIFNSGKIIITGGKTQEQILESYNFIYNILKNKKDYEIIEIKN